MGWQHFLRRHQLHRDWKAPVDDVHAIARAGRRLRTNRWEARRGLAALKAHNKRALSGWRDFIQS